LLVLLVVAIAGYSSCKISLCKDSWFAAFIEKEQYEDKLHNVGVSNLHFSSYKQSLHIVATITEV
jgi:hypothetical protein